MVIQIAALTDGCLPFQHLRDQFLPALLPASSPAHVLVKEGNGSLHGLADGQDAGFVLPEDVEAVQEDPLHLLLELHLVFVELGRVLPGDHEEVPECILQFLGFVVLAVEGLVVDGVEFGMDLFVLGDTTRMRGIGRGTKTKWVVDPVYVLEEDVVVEFLFLSRCLDEGVQEDIILLSSRLPSW